MARKQRAVADGMECPLLVVLNYSVPAPWECTPPEVIKLMRFKPGSVFRMVEKGAPAVHPCLPVLSRGFPMLK